MLGPKRRDIGSGSKDFGGSDELPWPAEVGSLSMRRVVAWPQERSYAAGVGPGTQRQYQVCVLHQAESVPLLVAAEAIDRHRPDAIDGRIVAELAVVVPTPTFRAAILGDCASVRTTRADVLGVVPQALDGDRGESIRSGAIAELAISVAAPALGLILAEGARMQSAAADGHHMVPKSGDLNRRVLELCGRATAKLAVLV